MKTQEIVNLHKLTDINRGEGGHLSAEYGSIAKVEKSFFFFFFFCDNHSENLGKNQQWILQICGGGNTFLMWCGWYLDVFPTDCSLGSGEK